MSEFHRVLLGLHAQARRIDRDHALLGALGVGAIAYAHQIDSVHRMISGTACRWLLADEVGLGKTIQAIMVMRALATQSARPLNVALVVPDDLAAQWSEELLSRGHMVPIEADDDVAAVGNIVLRIARPSLLIAAKRLAAAKIDLLVVDEFTRLQAQVRRDLIAAARIIPNVIILTATPALHLPATRRELLALLEPEADQVAQARNLDILDVLAEREARAVERNRGHFEDTNALRAVEEAYGVYRRLIRSQRADYPDTLPGRVYQPIRVAPTDGDVARSRTVRGYLDAAENSNVDIRHDALLQVAGRSPVSLRDRLSTLRRGTPSLQSAWQQIDNCLREEQGDAKIDALIDHLRGVNFRNPDARIVVVAEDNPTTDYLRDVIERLTDVRVAKKRRSIGAAAELDSQVINLKEALDDFVSGEAKVLVAADVAREGHNLQFADEIVFFALPWSPPHIQQWIGRIDRLGTKGLPANRRIAITPIVTNGSIEDRILDVLEITGVFNTSEVFDESEWEHISKAIASAADGSANGSWIKAAREAKVLGETLGSWLQATLLQPLPRTTIASRCEARFREGAYAVPMAPVEHYPWNWYLMRERASEMMLKLAQEDYLDVRRDKMDDQRFFTMWYKQKPGPGDLILPDLDTRSPRYRQAYITRRAAIECPPRTNVVQRDGENRRLHFFDHGCTLHDDAVAAFEQQMPDVDISTEFVVEYPNGHPALQWVGRRLLVASVELSLRNSISFDLDAVLGPPDTRISRPEQDARIRSGRIALAQFEADRRWMIDLAPSQMLFTVHSENSSEITLAEEAVSAIVDPTQAGVSARQISRQRCTLSEGPLKAARSATTARLRELGDACLKRAITAIRENIESRLFAAEADFQNLEEAARAELTLTEALDQKLEFNKAALRGALLSLALTQAVLEARMARLNGIEEALRSNSKLTKLRMFWISPRAPSVEAKRG